MEVGVEYLAGLLDGEGSIGIRRIRSRHTGMCTCFTLVLQMSLTHMKTVQDVHRDWGGVLYKQNGRKANHKPSLKWTVYGNKAAKVITAVQPFLRVKTEQAVVAVRFQSRMNENNRWGAKGMPPNELSFRESHYQEMRKLNKRGVL